MVSLQKLAKKEVIVSSSRCVRSFTCRKKGLFLKTGKMLCFSVCRKKGKGSYCSNFCGISLLSIGKVLSSVVLTHLALADDILPESQSRICLGYDATNICLIAGLENVQGAAL